VFAHHLPGGPGIPLGAITSGGGEQTAEALVARSALDEEGEAGKPWRRSPFASDRGARTNAQLGTDPGADPCLPSRLVEARGAIETIAIDEGDGGQLEFDRTGDEILGLRGTVEEGERGGDPKLCIVRSMTALPRGRLETALPQSFLAGSRRNVAGIGLALGSQESVAAKRNAGVVV
jgi:hypothetical protein